MGYSTLPLSQLFPNSGYSSVPLSKHCTNIVYSKVQLFEHLLNILLHIDGCLYPPLERSQHTYFQRALPYHLEHGLSYKGPGSNESNSDYFLKYED